MGGHVIRPCIERILKSPALLAPTNFYFVPTMNVDFAVDIHAGGIFRNHILMHMGDGEGCTVTRAANVEQEVWRDLLERHAGLRRSDGWALAQMRLRANDYFHQVHGATAFCLELSSCSWFDPTDGHTKAFSTNTFAAVGAGIARACEERFDV